MTQRNLTSQGHTKLLGKDTHSANFSRIRITVLIGAARTSTVACLPSANSHSRLHLACSSGLGYATRLICLTAWANRGGSWERDGLHPKLQLSLAESVLSPSNHPDGGDECLQTTVATLCWNFGFIKRALLCNCDMNTCQLQASAFKLENETYFFQPPIVPRSNTFQV